MVEIKYDRQSRIPKWDQNLLNNAKIAVIGAGALGNHVCQGLIGLGIGTIKIYDHDNIEAHNLNRQSMFCEKDIGRNKAETLAERLKKRNSSLIIFGIDQKIEEDTIDSILINVDMIIDCVDRIHVRRMLNRFCLMEDIPLIHGGISWIGGQVGILTRKTPCINCIYPKPVQEAELDRETSCIQNPEPSVVYISQIIAGFMVSCVRRVFLPLPDDPEIPTGLYKFDFRFHPPLYFEPITRKSQCECVKILQLVELAQLQKEQTAEQDNEKTNRKELLDFINDQNISNHSS